MSSRSHIHTDDLALYALQSLSAEEAAEIAEHLRGCSACRGEVAALQGDLAAFAVTTKLYMPPAAARQRLLQQIGRERRPAQQAPAAAAPAAGQGLDAAAAGSAASAQRGKEGAARPEVGGVGKRRSGGVGAWGLLGWLGWAVAAGGLVAAGSLYQQSEAMRSEMMAAKGRAALLAAEGAKGQAVIDALSDPAAMRVVVTQRSGGSQGANGRPEASGHVLYVPGKGTLIFLASNLEALPPEKSYALWLIRADGHNPVAAGAFRPDGHGDASVILPSLPKGVVARAFVVTVEEAGGATQPTLPILLSGAAD